MAVGGSSTGGSAPTIAGASRRASPPSGRRSSVAHRSSRRRCGCRAATRCSASTASAGPPGSSSSRSRTRRRRAVRRRARARPGAGRPHESGRHARGSWVTVDGRPALRSPRPAMRWAAGMRGDTLDVVTAGRAQESTFNGVGGRGMRLRGRAAPPGCAPEALAARRRWAARAAPCPWKPSTSPCFPTPPWPPPAGMRSGAAECAWSCPMLGCNSGRRRARRSSSSLRTRAAARAATRSQPSRTGDSTARPPPRGEGSDSRPGPGVASCARPHAVVEHPNPTGLGFGHVHVAGRPGALARGGP